MYPDQDTIAAVATPPGVGGIGVIKISGPGAAAIGNALFHPSQNAPPGPRRLCHGTIVDADANTVVDQVLFAVMRGPHSYTGEDVVEIQAHSGTVVLNKILHLVLSRGARLAEPGEFTKRAFLNGRIDLTQAEAIVDLIHAKTERAAASAAALLDGGLKNDIQGFRRDIVQLAAEVEADIDFPEEDTREIRLYDWQTRLLDGVVAPIRKIVANYDAGRLLRQGLKCAIVGAPNVGKSSLMNRLLGSERVIVTPTPGTTRDLIEEAVNIDGLPVVFSDTAGLHGAADPIERIGMEKTRQSIADADLVLFVLDVSRPMDAEESQLVDMIKNKGAIVVFNKMDIAPQPPVLQVPEPYAHLPVCRISALYGQGIDQLKGLILAQAVEGTSDGAGSDILPNLRQKQMLENCQRSAEAAAAHLEDGAHLELAAFELREAVLALEATTGQHLGEEILGSIFEQFCVGK